MRRNEHNPPHVHVRCAEDEARVAIRSHRVIEGVLPENKRRLVEEWVELHRDELLVLWQNRAAPGGIKKIDD